MKSRLCIILQSMYPPNTKEHERWSAEVQVDSETVRETLADHDVLEIFIPIRAKPSDINTLVAQSLTTYIKQNYESCHIVLNTHGAAGASDLADEAVKQVVQSVSSLDIPISQLSALQCNGMSALLSAEQREADPMKPTHATARGKNSSMSILQQKLNHMGTTKPQTFTIYGFNTAYDPKVDRALVTQVLRGEGVSLDVKTTVKQSRNDYLKQIEDSIKVIRETEAANRIDNRQYDTAGNVLGSVFELMRTNLCASLRNATSPNPEDIPLLRKLEDFAAGEGRSLNATNAEVTFKRWAKQNKIYSKERLEILENYCALLSSSVQDRAHKEPSLEAKTEPQSSTIRRLGIFAHENSADTENTSPGIKVGSLPKPS